MADNISCVKWPKCGKPRGLSGNLGVYCQANFGHLGPCGPKAHEAVDVDRVAAAGYHVVQEGTVPPWMEPAWAGPMPPNTPALYRLRPFADEREPIAWSQDHNGEWNERPLTDEAPAP